MKKHGFTLIELLIAISIIAIALLSIFSMMSAAQTTTDRTRQETLAINFAREGVEAVINIRNTNWLRRSGKRDANWLCSDPSLEKDDTVTTCGAWMSGGKSYIVQYTGITQQYPRLILTGSAIGGGSIGDQELSFNDTLDDDMFLIASGAEGNFYRAIRGKGLYQKDTNIIGGGPISCVDGAGNYNKRTLNGSSTNSTGCNDSTPKEFQFCSKVLYRKQGQGEVELCDIITNYKE